MRVGARAVARAGACGAARGHVGCAMGVQTSAGAHTGGCVKSRRLPAAAGKTPCWDMCVCMHMHMSCACACATAAFSWLPGTTMQMRGVQGTVYNTLSLTNPAQDVSRVHANQRVLTHTACRQTWFSGRDDMTCFPTVMAMIGLAPSNTWQRYHPFSSGNMIVRNRAIRRVPLNIYWRLVYGFARADLVCPPTSDREELAYVMERVWQPMWSCRACEYTTTPAPRALTSLSKCTTCAIGTADLSNCSAETSMPSRLAAPHAPSYLARDGNAHRFGCRHSLGWVGVGDAAVRVRVSSLVSKRAQARRHGQCRRKASCHLPQLIK